MHVRDADNPRRAGCACVGACGCARAAAGAGFAGDGGGPGAAQLERRQAGRGRCAEGAGCAGADPGCLSFPTLNFGSGLPALPAVGFTGGLPSIVNAQLCNRWSSAFLRASTSRRHARGLEAATLNLKDAREQVALDASTAYIELDTVNQRTGCGAPAGDFRRSAW